MAKIVIPDVPVIGFDSALPIEIIDHTISQDTDHTIFKYRVRFQVKSLDVLRKPIFLNFSSESPYRPKLNMFKNRNISTTASALDAIKTYDERRFNGMRQEKSIIVSRPIEYTDIDRGYADFEVDLSNTGIMTIYAYFTSRLNQSTEILSMYSFDNSKIIERYEMPYDDFVFNTQVVGNNFRRILVGTNDKRIGYFKVSTRSLFGVNQSQLDTQGKTYSIRMLNNTGFIDIPEVDTVCREYRVSPVSFLSKTALSQYKKALVNDDKLQTGKCIVYASEVGSQFATIAVESIPAGVVSVSLLRRNITQREIKYDTILVTGNIGSVANGITDRTIIPYNAYDYKVRLEFANGNKLISESNCVVFPMTLNDVANLKVTSLSSTVTNGISTNKFNILVDYKSVTQPARVINDLKTLGINNIFPNEIKNLSTQIEPLISVLVTKVSLKNETEERVGLFKPGDITIQTTDTTDSIYLFEICVRSPADVIEEIGSSSDFTSSDMSSTANRSMTIDRVLSLNNVVNPKNFTQKFFSKRSLTKGNLAYGQALQTSSSGLESGRTGIRKTLLIKNERVAPTINFTSAVRKNDGLYIKWTAQNTSDVTHFEIQTADGRVQTCDVDNEVQNYAATIRTSLNQVTLRAHTNYDVIITTEFTA